MTNHPSDETFLDEMAQRPAAIAPDGIELSAAERDRLVALARQAPALTWQPMETAPKDGTKVDLWAKCWLPHNDTFTGRRNPDCYWTEGDSMSGRNPHWRNLESGWFPTHWMPHAPAPPEAR